MTPMEISSLNSASTTSLEILKAMGSATLKLYLLPMQRVPRFGSGQGQTSSGVDIPLRVRDIQFAQVTSSDITPPNVDLIRTPITAPTSAIQFTLEVTDESGLQFVNGPIPEVTITGDGGYQVDLNSIAGNGIDGGTAFFYQLSPRSSDQWTSADNGVYSVTVNSGAFSDSVGNLVEQQLAGTFLVSIS